MRCPSKFPLMLIKRTYKSLRLPDGSRQATTTDRLASSSHKIKKKDATHFLEFRCTLLDSGRYRRRISSVCGKCYRWAMTIIIGAIWGGRDENETHHRSMMASKVRRNMGSFRSEHRGRGSQNAIASASPHTQRPDVMVILPS